MDSATSANPFIPRATVIRFPNSTFEARIHLSGAAAHIDVVPHENFILVTGSLTPRVHVDSEGRANTLLFTDQPCGVFGRDIPVNLAAGTEIVVLSTHQDCDDYVIRYTIRNAIRPRANCADVANANAHAFAASGPCPCPPGLKGSCGRGIPTGSAHVVGPHAGSYAVPPALLHRGPGVIASAGYGHAHLDGYAAYGYGYGHAYGRGNGAAYPHGCAAQPLNHSILHHNGGATSA